MNSKPPQNFNAPAQPRGAAPSTAATVENSANPRQTKNADHAPADTQEIVLFFDGVCGLCNRFVDFTLSHDRNARIRLAPLQGETARARLPATDVQSLDSVVLLDERGVHRRSTAVVRVLRQFSFAWRILAGLLWLIPRPLRDFGYKLVASNRYRMFGKKETCRMPSPSERARFLP